MQPLKIFQCALFFHQLKGGCESITHLNLIHSLFQGFDKGNSLYQKLWTHLDKKGKMQFEVDKNIFINFGVLLRVRSIKHERAAKSILVALLQSYLTDGKFEFYFY